MDSCLKSIIKPGTVLKNIWSVWDRLGVFLINSVLTGCDGRTLLEHSLDVSECSKGGLDFAGPELKIVSFAGKLSSDGRKIKLSSSEIQGCP